MVPFNNYGNCIKGAIVNMLFMPVCVGIFLVKKLRLGCFMGNQLKEICIKYIRNDKINKIEEI